MDKIEDVNNYVKASIILSQKGTKCFDGRYLPNQGRGMLSRPGADCGYVMALEAVNRKKNLGLTSEQCFNAVFRAVTKLNGIFYFHTDEYDASGYIGCDHLASAARHGYSWEYDIRSKDVREMINYARNLCEVSSEIKMINLTGDHHEKGVLIVRSSRYTVVADNPKRHEMYRVYDVDRDREFMEELIQEMDIKNVTLKDMLHEANLQLDATLQNFAIGLPVYEVSFEGSKPKVTFVNYIEQKSFFKRIHLPPNLYFSFHSK